MFPPVRTRTRAALLRAMDRAIEFATLGEYGLEVPGADDVPAPGTGRSAHSVARRSGAVGSPGRLPRRVQAATPAGRRAAGQAAPRVTTVPPQITAVPTPQLTPAPPQVTRVPTPLFRQRGGAPPAPRVWCWAAGERPGA